LIHLDATVRGFDLAHVAGWARRCEELGVERLWTTETNHDPFFPLVLAAAATERVGLATGVAIALPRSPMHVAYAAWDLQQLSRGRFVLGVGSQIKPHIRHRFSSTWDKPVARLRELVLAVKAIHAAWQGDTELAFRGDFYHHTLMPPAFRPERLGPWAPPPVVMAAYRPAMLEAAGEVADGILVHPLQSVRYVRDTVLPSVEAGLARAGRVPGDAHRRGPRRRRRGAAPALHQRRLGRDARPDHRRDPRPLRRARAHRGRHRRRDRAPLRRPGRAREPARGRALGAGALGRDRSGAPRLSLCRA
jgi:alkanesulfonate monooxygenase SsuD/methylene tetrahydromethanopterin reductase-like flavin-dependent oxidoreductase (luciferase family)